MKRTLVLIFLIASIVSIAASCKEPKSKTVVNHIIKSKYEGKRWNPTYQIWETRWTYHFIDGDSLKTSINFNVGDTVPYNIININQLNESSRNQ